MKYKYPIDDNISFNSIEELKSKLIDFKILFAYHSNVIENPQIDFHTTREVFEGEEIKNFSGNYRTLFEIINQKECYEFILEKIIKKEPLSVDLIKQIHYKLAKGTYDDERYNIKGERPGEFKMHDYVTGKNEVGVPPEYVEEYLSDLIDEINSFSDKTDDYYTVVAYLHAEFEKIHPFADGNGRTGRTLVNYYLLINNKKPLIIYNEDRKIYYDCLEKYDTEDELEPLIKFLKYEQHKTWTKQNNVEKTSSLSNHLNKYNDDTYDSYD